MTMNHTICLITTVAGLISAPAYGAPACGYYSYPPCY